MSCLGPRIATLRRYDVSLTRLPIRSLDVVAGDLGIEGVDDFSEEEDEQPAGEENNNLLEEFNGDDLVGELRNNQQPEGGQLRNNVLRNDLPVGINNRIMVPQTPAVAVAPYQAYLATGSMTRPPFVANRSAGKFSAEDYYQQMIMSRMERQEIEEQERERRRAEREERLAELEIQRQEREQKLEEEKRQRERDQEEERRERAEDRKAERDMMSMLMMAMVGRSMSGDDSPARKRRKKKGDDSSSD